MPETPTRLRVLHEPLRVVLPILTSADSRLSVEERETAIRSFVRGTYGYEAEQLTRLPDPDHLVNSDSSPLTPPEDTTLIVYEVSVHELPSPTERQLAAREGLHRRA
jgi:hypothetical protein